MASASFRKARRDQRRAKVAAMDSALDLDRAESAAFWTDQAETWAIRRTEYDAFNLATKSRDYREQRA